MATRRFPVKLAPLAWLTLSMGSLLPVYANGTEAAVSPPILMPVDAAPSPVAAPAMSYPAPAPMFSAPLAYPGRAGALPTYAPVSMPPMTGMPAMPIMLVPMMAPGTTGGTMPPGFPGWPAMPYPVWVPIPMNWLAAPARGTPPDARPSGGLGAAPMMTAPVSASPAQSVMPAQATAASESGPAETGGTAQPTAPPGLARESVSPQTQSGTEVIESVLPVAPAATVDYGPISPSPVVALPPIEAESASQAKPADGKPAQKKARKPKSGKTQEAPKKNRMCWSNGRVSPCLGGATSQSHDTNRVNPAP
jgi:hypothetical protein